MTTSVVTVTSPEVDDINTADKLKINKILIAQSPSFGFGWTSSKMRKITKNSQNDRYNKDLKLGAS